MRHKSNRSRNNAFESIFENIFDVSISEALGSDFITTHPAANVINGEDEYIIKVFAPGLNKENFDISIKDNQLTVKTIISDEDESTMPKYTRREFSYNRFSRSFSLDHTIDLTKIEADYVDGVLNIHLAKKEEAKDNGPLVIKIK